MGHFVDALLTANTAQREYAAAHGFPEQPDANSQQQGASQPPSAAPSPAKADVGSLCNCLCSMQCRLLASVCCISSWQQRALSSGLQAFCATAAHSSSSKHAPPSFTSQNRTRRLLSR